MCSGHYLKRWEHSSIREWELKIALLRLPDCSLQTYRLYCCLISNRDFRAGLLMCKVYRNCCSGWSLDVHCTQVDSIGPHSLWCRLAWMVSMDITSQILNPRPSLTRSDASSLPLQLQIYLPATNTIQTVSQYYPTSTTTNSSSSSLFVTQASLAKWWRFMARRLSPSPYCSVWCNEAYCHIWW